MTFEEVHKKITALRIKSIDYNYLKSKVVLETEPEYGFKPEFKEKKIRFIFGECIFFVTTNLSVNKYDSTTEVINWGKKKDLSVLVNFMSNSIAKNFNDFKLSNLDYKNLPKDYELYFFENVFGDLIYILSRKNEIEID